MGCSQSAVTIDEETITAKTDSSQNIPPRQAWMKHLSRKSLATCRDDCWRLERCVCSSIDQPASPPERMPSACACMFLSIVFLREKAHVRCCLLAVLSALVREGAPFTDASSGGYVNSWRPVPRKENAVCVRALLACLLSTCAALRAHRMENASVEVLANEDLQEQSRHEGSKEFF